MNENIDNLTALARTQKLAMAILILLLPPTCFGIRPPGLWGTACDSALYAAGIIVTDSYLIALSVLSEEYRRKWLYLVLSLIPGGAFVSWWCLNREATAQLRKEGYQVGWLGCNFEPLPANNSDGSNRDPDVSRTNEEPTAAQMKFVRFTILSAI